MKDIYICKNDMSPGVETMTWNDLTIFSLKLSLKQEASHLQTPLPEPQEFW